MKIVMLSTDPRVMVFGTDAYQRMQEYATLFNELHLVALSEKKEKPTRVNTLCLYPVYSSHKFLQRLRMFLIAWSVCRQSVIDIISVQAPDEIGVIGFVLARFFRIPLQVQMHGDMFSPHYCSLSWKERLRVLLARFLVPRASCLRVVSARIAQSVQSLLRTSASKCPVSVLPIFTNVEPFARHKNNHPLREKYIPYEFRMISLGRFVDKEKNFSMLIDVMADFVKISPNALLVIAGDGPDKNKYRANIAAHRLEKHVILEPWQDNLPEFYPLFDLFLLPSNYEGWGRVVIEAMASGLPVVMTDVGLAGEIVRDGENGAVVPVGDRKKFFEAVVELYRNGALRDRYRRTALQTLLFMTPQTKDEYLLEYKKSFFGCLSNHGPFDRHAKTQ